MSGANTRDIAEMFDRISRTYDRLNHLFSLGVDRHWRRKAIRELKLGSHAVLLDCGAGTGDMALTALRSHSETRLVLLDPALSMLKIADAKAGDIPPDRFVLVRGCAEGLPFPDSVFDNFMVAFGIRNFANLPAGIAELHRVLRPGGRGVILEFTPDRSRRIDRMFQWYMRRILIPLGARVSRNPVAYAYLSDTMAAFLTSGELEQLFSRTGFVCRSQRRLSAAIATLFV
ncbi:MAG: ubiquinone/menaquinone biosynthesis methyltransferase, partial [bacterium]|nr:ubiquinone/menaquinone biosynthesis methyltransferase [bacterium]